MWSFRIMTGMHSILHPANSSPEPKPHNAFCPHNPPPVSLTDSGFSLSFRCRIRCFQDLTFLLISV